MTDHCHLNCIISIESLSRNKLYIKEAFDDNLLQRMPVSQAGKTCQLTNQQHHLATDVCLCLAQTLHVTEGQCDTENV